jgi:hypothetical protein
MRMTDFAARATLFGAGGWAIENVLFKEEPRYSALFKGEKVPFLPVYAFGGAAVMLLAPRLCPMKARICELMGNFANRWAPPIT